MNQRISKRKINQTIEKIKQNDPENVVIHYPEQEYNEYVKDHSLKIYGAGFPYEVIIYAENKTQAMQYLKDNQYTEQIELDELEDIEEYIFYQRLKDYPSINEKYQEYLNTGSKGYILMVDENIGFPKEYTVIHRNTCSRENYACV